MAGEVRVWLLGEFRVSLDGVPVPATAWRRSRARALVKVLALAPGHRLHRDRLLDCLWPDLSRDAAAANLRKAVHFARQAIGAAHIDQDGDLVRLAAATVWVDVDAFEAAADRGDRHRALAHYGGDLLEADHFEPWTQDRREQLRVRHHRLLRDMARELVEAGDHAAVAAYAHLVAADPLDEEAVAGLMRAYAAAGERGSALREFESLAARLREELAVAPAMALRRLREDIANGRLSARETPPIVAVTEERKLVSVVRLDLPAAAHADPEHLRADLAVASERAAGIVQDWGGCLQRFVGGGILGVFGVPATREDDAVRAIHAALDLKALAPLAGVGVGTGEVIARGTEAAPMAGEVFTIAERLREAAAPGVVLTSERTWRSAGGQFRFGLEVTVSSPGGTALIGRPVITAAEAGHRTARPVRMVGREAETEVLVRLFGEVVEAGQPRLVTIVGAAGVGKSRLVREAMVVISASQPGTAVHTGRCPSAGPDAVYAALADIVRSVCGYSVADPPETATRLCRDGLRGLLPEAAVDVVAATCGAGPATGLDPRAVAEELARARPRLVSVCADRGPTVLILEDLHWARPELIDLLQLILARANGPALVIATTRPEGQPRLGPIDAAAAMVSLRPLTAEQSATLLDDLTTAKPLPEPLAQRVLARAAGNPFFLEELALHVGSGQDAVPDSVHAVLAARIDALPVAEKAILRRAAVIGSPFWAAPVALMLDTDPPSVATVLRSLERRGFVQTHALSTVVGHDEFSFRHALTEEVAYAGVPVAERARSHAAIGEWLTEVSPGDTTAELLAYHFHAAATPDALALAWPVAAEQQAARDRAYDCLMTAGALSRARSATSTAISVHERALDLANTAPRRLAALEELGDDLDASYQGEQAAAHYVAALELARGRAEWAADRSRLCRKVAWLMTSTPGAFRVSPDPAVVEQFIAEGTAAATDDVSRAWLYVVTGMLARLWRGSEPFGQGTAPDPVPVAHRIRDVQAAMATGTAAEVAELVKAAAATLAVLQGIAGDYPALLAATRCDLAGLDSVATDRERANVLRTAAVVTVTIEAGFAAGLDLAQRALALSAGNHHQRMHCTWPVLASLYHLGRWVDLRPVLADHVRAVEQEPAYGCHFVRDGAIIGATVAAHQGDRAAARALAAPIGDPLADLDSASAWQARFALAMGDPATARQISAAKALEGRLYGPQHAVALIEALVELQDWVGLLEFMPAARGSIAGNQMLAPHCDRAAGRADMAVGRPREAGRHLRRALAGFEELSVPFEAACTRELLAALATGARARAFLEPALATYLELGARPLARRLMHRLAQA